MKRCSAIKTDLFADEHHRKKIDSLGDPLAEIESHIDFGAPVAEIDRVAPRAVSAQGGRPSRQTETMVRILVLKRLYKLSDEQMECQWLDCMSYKRFYGRANATNGPDRTTVWVFENWIGEEGAKVLFDGVSAQLVKQRFIARGGEIMGATLVPPPKRRQTDTDATSTKKHCKSQLSINVDKKYKIIRKIETDTASTHDSQHFDKVFDAGNTSGDVYADQGYPSEEREAWLNENGFRNQIQREGASSHTECRQRCNQRIAKMRARGEHVFGAIEQMGAAHHRSGAGELRHDDDGHLLQSQTVRLFQKGWNRVFLTPNMGRILAAHGDSTQERGNAEGKNGGSTKKLDRVRSRSSVHGGTHRRPRVIRGAS